MTRTVEFYQAEKRLHDILRGMLHLSFLDAAVEAAEKQAELHPTKTFMAMVLTEESPDIMLRQTQVLQDPEFDSLRHAVRHAIYSHHIYKVHASRQLAIIRRFAPGYDWSVIIRSENRKEPALSANDARLLRSLKIRWKPTPTPVDRKA